MAAPGSTEDEGTTAQSGFRISEGPVVRGGIPQAVIPSELSDLPRVYGAPMLFSIPRDPRTVFNYWNVDWSSVFAGGEPPDRQVYLRLKKSDGSEESEIVIEPMLGSYYAEVTEPGAQYYTELGYHSADGGWSVIATSEPVTMPLAAASADTDIDLATVPFHLSFQRLIDLFRGTKGNPLSLIVGKLQKRAVNSEDEAPLTPEEHEIFRAMDVSVEQLEASYEAFRRDAEALRKKAEALLGFGASSPAHGFGSGPGSSGGSSWSSSPSGSR
jgi:hypothetical protein